MKRRILFVDDEPLVLDGLRDRLRRRRREWDMCFVESGAEALASLGRQPCEVIVSDMRMPAMDGVELLTRVRERFPGTARIILSGHAESDRVLRSVPVAHQFLTKPSDPGVLELVVDRACRLRDLIPASGILGQLGGLDGLPTTPFGAGALDAALGRSEAGVEEVANLVAGDASLGARMLQIVNSGFVHLAREVVSLEEAVHHIGLEQVRRIARTTDVFRPTRRNVELLERHRGQAVRTAAAAAACFGDRLPAAELAAAGLLHDVGKTALAVIDPALARRIRDEALHRGVPEHAVEMERLGTTHAEMGGYLLGLWGLPPRLVSTAAHHHAPARGGDGAFDLLTAIHVTDALLHGREETLDLDHLESLGLAGELPAWRERIAGREPATIS